MHGAQLSRSTYAHCAPRRSALPCGQNGSCRRHMLCPLCAQHSMLHALRPMRVALHICAPIYLVCCAACMRHGTMCCMPLQVRSAALRHIYMHNLKNRCDICTTPTRNDRVYFVQTPCRKLDAKNRRAHFAAERSDFSVYFGRVSYTY